MATLQITPPYLWTAGTILPVLCTAIVGARFAVRNKQRASVGVDDWLVLPALVLIIGMGVSMLVGTAQKGLGYPSPYVQPAKILTTVTPPQLVARKWFLAMTLLQVSALTFIKLSCMFFYRRVFRVSAHSGVDIAIHIVNALIVIWGVSFFFAFLFGCGTNFDWLWTTLERQLSCSVDFTKLDLAISISDVIMDVITMVFPVPLILGLQMSTANKIAVLGIFSLGALAIAASITRLEIIVMDTNVEFAATADQDFLSTSGGYFMYLEACLGLCAICLPSLSGALKFKGVQTLIAGFSNIFSSIRSRGSGSGSDRSSRRTHDRLGSSHSHLAPPSSHGHGTPRVMSQGGAQRDVELYKLSSDRDILVTNSFDRHSSKE